MESAIQTMVKVFLKSTKGKESLGQKEFQHLVKSQLCHILTDTDSKEAINNMGQGLDADQDGKVGFEEYLKLVGYLAVSLSEQRVAAAAETPQNAAGAQVAQSAPAKEEKPEANAEAKAEAEEVKPEASEEANAEAAPEVKVEAKPAPKAVVEGGSTEPVVALSVAPGGVEVNAEGATAPEAASEEAKPEALVAAAAAAEEAINTGEAVVKEEVVAMADKVEEAEEKLAADVEKVEKKIEEETS